MLSDLYASCNPQKFIATFGSGREKKTRGSLRSVVGCVRTHNDARGPTAALHLQRALQVPRGERRPSLSSTLVYRIYSCLSRAFLRPAASLNRSRRCTDHVAVSEHRPQLLQQRGLLRARGLHLSDLLHHVPHGEPDTSIAPRWAQCTLAPLPATDADALRASLPPSLPPSEPARL